MVDIANSPCLHNTYWNLQHVGISAMRDWVVALQHSAVQNFLSVGCLLGEPGVQPPIRLKHRDPMIIYSIITGNTFLSSPSSFVFHLRGVYIV